jgi:superfamily II DNA or RNA helicase
MMNGICKNVEYVNLDEEYVYDLEVENYHNYFANDVLVHNCGSGKTVGGIGLIQKCKQPSLVIVPDNELVEQWCQQLVDVMDIDVDRIGVISSEHIFVKTSLGSLEIEHKIGDITISTNQSLYNRIDNKKFANKFGLVLLDEAHMVGARTFREVMNSFPAKYKFGLTATPFRNDTLTDLIEAYCGTQFYTVTDDELLEAGLLVKPTLYVVPTDFKYKYNYKYRNAYNYMLKYIERDKKRNNLIVKKILEEVEDERMVLVIAKTVNHCKILSSMLKERDFHIKIGFMAGENYNEKTAMLARKGDIDVIFAVNRAKQGLDIKPLESLFIVAPRKAKGEIQQMVGRVQRPDCCFGKYSEPSKKDARVFDFVDVDTPILFRSFKQRLKVYKEKCIILLKGDKNKWIMK